MMPIVLTLKKYDYENGNTVFLDISFGYILSCATNRIWNSFSSDTSYGFEVVN